MPCFRLRLAISAECLTLAAALCACGSSPSSDRPKTNAEKIEGTVSACTDITSPGSYTLDSDIAPAGTGCIHIHDTSDVTFDCANHRLQDGGSNVINVENASNVTVKNCLVSGGSTSPLLALFRVKGATLSGIDIRWATVSESDDVTFTQNHFHYSLNLTLSNRCLIQDNTFDNADGAFNAALFSSIGGAGNRVIGNAMDGRWNGDPALFDVTGTDDGIVLSDEVHDVISGNTITNVWDTGIETVSAFSDSQVSDNRISNCYVSAIGGWYWNSWRRNTVSGNSASNTGLVFNFSRVGEFRATDAADATIDFRDNTFSGNSGSAGSNFLMDNAMSWATDTRNSNPGDFRVGNNVFANNDFHGQNLTIVPWFLATDGGGNQCAPSSWELGAALECIRPPQARVFDDVPSSDGNFLYINAMKADGITKGCSVTPSLYCASDPLLRQQTAVFIIRALYGEQFTYSPDPYFPADVPATNVYFPYIQKLRDLRITQGCASDTFCATAGVTRGELAVFLMRAKYGADSVPSPPATPYFADVATSDPFYPYIQAVRAANAMPGCSVDNFCPGKPLTRDEVSGFVMRMLRPGG